MAVTSLLARCANCGTEELLSRIAEDAGSCPSCQLSFCDDSLATGVPWKEGTELPSAVTSYLSLFAAQLDELPIDLRIDHSEEVAR